MRHLGSRAAFRAMGMNLGNEHKPVFRPFDYNPKFNHCIERRFTLTHQSTQYKSLVKSLKQINTYLQTNDNHSYRKLKKYFRLCNKGNVNRDFHLINIGSNSDIRRQVEQLFTHLEIDKTQWLLHFDPKLTVYQFLKEMAEKNKSKKLNDILQLLDAKLSWSKGQLLLLVLGITGISLLAYFVPSFQALLTAEIDLTIIGFGYTSAVAAYKLRQNYYCELNKSSFAKARDTFFLIANILLNLTAYGLWIAASGVMTPLIAGLFIASSVSDVAKEMFLGIENNLRYVEEKEILQSTGINYVQRIRIARVDYEYRKHRNAALINLNGALILSGLIATWCLVPGSAFMTIGIIAAILLVQTATYLVNKWNHSRNKEALTTQLMEIHQDNELQGKKKNQLLQTSSFPNLVEKAAEYKNSPLFSPRKAQQRTIPKLDLPKSPSEDKAVQYGSLFTPPKPSSRGCIQTSKNQAHDPRGQYLTPAKKQTFSPIFASKENESHALATVSKPELSIAEFHSVKPSHLTAKKTAHTHTSLFMPLKSWSRAMANPDPGFKSKPAENKLSISKT